MNESNAYEVVFTAHQTVVVLSAANEEEAEEFARNETDLPMGSIYESTVRPITTAQDLESSKRHADKVSKP